MMVVLFTLEHQFLGEFTFDQGSLKQSILSHAGEQLLGATLSRWMTRGIPFLREMTSPNDAKQGIEYQEFIQTKDSEAIVAFYRWAQDHQLLAIDIAPPLFPYWEKLLRLPFAPQERIGILLAMRSTYQEALDEWKECFTELERVIEVESLQMQKAKEKTKRKATQAIAGGLRKKSH